MNDHHTLDPKAILFDDATHATEALHEKLADALIPGHQAELDPDEAERAGAFIEDALSAQAATESSFDLLEAIGADGQEG